MLMCFHRYTLHFVFVFLFCSGAEELVTVTTGEDTTELNITGFIPFTNYTLNVEGVTVEIGDKSADVMVMTFENGEGVMVVRVYVCACVGLC